VLKITQVRSGIGSRRNQRETLRSLGLRKIRHSVVRDDSPQVRGMIATVQHLVSVETVQPSGSVETVQPSGSVETVQPSGSVEEVDKA